MTNEEAIQAHTTRTDAFTPGQTVYMKHRTGPARPVTFQRRDDSRSYGAEYLVVDTHLQPEAIVHQSLIWATEPEARRA